MLFTEKFRLEDELECIINLYIRKEEELDDLKISIEKEEWRLLEQFGIINENLPVPKLPISSIQPQILQSTSMGAKRHQKNAKKLQVVLCAGISKVK